MPNQRFTKTATIKAVNQDTHTATGVVLEPDALDHQADFLRPDAIANFHSPNPDTGVMHAAFPNGAATLTRNEVLPDDTSIDGEDFQAGQWVVTREYHDDDLWQLVDDGVLTGFSIGGTIENAIEHDSLPDDVAVPADVEHEEGMGVTELVNGSVDEISDVDIPAVPAATYKSALGKNILDQVDSQDQFVDLMVEQRGHTKDDAERLWSYMQAHKSTSKQESYDDYPQAAVENARMALNAREETGNPNDCGTRVGWERASQLDNGESLSAETVGRMAAFRRHEDNATQGDEGRADCGWMMWKAWGGEAGVSWAERIVDQREENGKARLGRLLLARSLDGVWFARKQDFPEEWPFSEDPSEGFEECKREMQGEVDDEAAFCSEWMRESLGVGPEDLEQSQDMTQNDTDEPDDATKWKQLKSWLKGSTTSGTDDDTTSEDTTVELDADTAAKAMDALKRGRPLNTRNRNALMAAHDAIESALTSDVDFRQNRFTDDPTVDFNLSDYGKAKTTDTTGTNTDTDNMTDTDTDDDGEDAKSLAEQNAEQIADLSDAVKSIADTLTTEDGDGSEKASETTEGEEPSQAEKNAEQIAELATAVEQIGKQSGLSTQLGGTEKTNSEENGELDEATKFKRGLVGGH